MANKHLFIDYLEAIEWYDGTVRGVVRNESSQFLVVLVESDIRKQRRYVLLEIDRSSYERLLNCFMDDNKTKIEKWNIFEVAYESIVASYNGTSCFLLSGEIDGVKQIGVDIEKFEKYRSKVQNYDFQNKIV